ncbi:methylmalonyl-CoA mutase [Peribacillus cavernae]|uniref:Methylmalonyl-CoA mutase n=1 Tax=Peribacillus cavernae TaxID=1674310 RepID=A0A433H948_9BACI|nr:methylmalonyl-CoA mutase family protein [Peribacillus cavernae]MDQ0220781.1 methylmalonyl-CoA mutase [Peribacillus cavernae]RUQ24792.1 methylmalonyl-CoA mutase [Peribacillus cavernae]
MKLNEVKTLSFPSSSIEDWKVAAESSLKGKSVEKLNTNTYEGIELQPLYTEESLSENTAGEELPGFFPYTRGINVTGYRTNPWLICQPVFAFSEEEANQKMHTALSRGQNAICFPASLLSGTLNNLLNRLPFKEVPIFIDLEGNGHSALPRFNQYCEKANLNTGLISGVLAEDPIAEWAAAGKLPSDIDNYFKGWFSGIQEAGGKLPNVKTILIKTSVYHNGGANAVQEVAYGLAEAVHYLNEGQEYGLSLAELTDKIVFSFAIDSNYFMNIAKLRAARRLWAMLAEAYGVSPDYFKMHIHAVTSRVTETLYDKHVNILRTANQAFAAVVGGVQYLQIHPFDRLHGTENDFAERLARNTQLILKEETHISTVVDPAGGSFFVEKLTSELTEAVWSKFLEIEQQGGILNLLKKGTIQAEIADVFKQRQRNTGFRKESIIGTNVYPNPAEKVQEPQTNSEKSTAALDIIPIPHMRVAEEFENIRLRAEAHAESGEAPKLGVITIGELKAYKARADFIKGISGSGGIGTIESKGCTTVDEVLAFVTETNLKSYCICGSDADYLETAAAFARAIKEGYPEKNLYLAGKQDSELEKELKLAGVKDFLHIKTNVVEILTQLLTELEVK